MNKTKSFQIMFFSCLVYVLVSVVAARANAEPLQAQAQHEAVTDRVIVLEYIKTPVKPTETPTAAVVISTVAPTVAPTIPETTEHTYKMYFTEQDAQAVAQMLWGEARGCTLEDKQNCVRTVCNRVDDSRFPNTPYEVVTQYYQYHGYCSSNPVDSELYEISVAILTDWSLKKQGIECEWYSYNCFSGDGTRNYFYTI